MLSFLFDEEKMFKDAMEDFRAEGEAKGRVRGFIEAMLDDGRTNKEIIKRLIKKFALTEAEAREKLSSYAAMA